LQPIIEHGVQNYTRELISETGIDVALEWHLMHHSYNEGNYLSQMTALEHLVSVFREKKPSNRVLQKSKFRNILKPALQEKLDEIIPQLCDDSLEKEDCLKIIEEFKNKIGNLNQQSLQSSTESMLSEYCVPLDGLNDFIPDLINVRNDIIHRGLHNKSTNQKSLSIYLLVAEELLRRIFLALLNYEGKYNTYFMKNDYVLFKKS
jgi:hypothetical protein